MSYLALYRKYRPQGFDGLVGQEHIVKTLTRQIETGRIGHAYLFSGTRGTGKTSTARIFAKAINCEHPVGGSPCGKCPTCLGLDNPSNLDIIEIDAASNNRVDEIRDLRETVAFPPTVGKYKVYIIDEVHMLTDQAFNALLKTLEEPPSFAVFILATTEAYKVPQTILSRCMRFDFRLIPEEIIAEQIKKIYDELGKEYEEEAVLMIAKAGAGSMRDALSVADVCVSYGEGKLTYNDVLEVLGASDKSYNYELVRDILLGNCGDALVKLSALIEKGKGIGVINNDVISLLRDIFVCKQCVNPNKILHLPKAEEEKLNELAKTATPEKIMRAIELFSSVEGELKWTTHPRITLESVVIKASQPDKDWDIQALLARISKLEKEVENGEFTVKQVVTLSQPSVQAAAEVKEEPALKPVENKITAEEFYKQEKQTKKLSDAKPLELLGLLNRRLRQNKEIMLWALFQNLKLGVHGNVLTVFVESDGDKTVLEKPNNIQTVKRMLDEYGDIEVEVKITGEDIDKKEMDEGIDEIKRIFGDIVKTD